MNQKLRQLSSLASAREYPTSPLHGTHSQDTANDNDSAQPQPRSMGELRARVVGWLCRTSAKWRLAIPGMLRAAATGVVQARLRKHLLERRSAVSAVDVDLAGQVHTHKRSRFAIACVGARIRCDFSRHAKAVGQRAPRHRLRPRFPRLAARVWPSPRSRVSCSCLSDRPSAS